MHFMNIVSISKLPVVIFLHHYFKLYTCERILEQEGVHGNVTIDEFPLDLVPLDKDILSLELPEFLRSVFLVSTIRVGPQDYLCTLLQ